MTEVIASGLHPTKTLLPEIEEHKSDSPARLPRHRLQTAPPFPTTNLKGHAGYLSTLIGI